MEQQTNKSIKTVDEFGRILIPKSIRTQMDIKPGDTLCYQVDADRIILRKTVEKCIFCNGDIGVTTVMGRPVCSACIEKLKQE